MWKDREKSARKACLILAMILAPLLGFAPNSNWAQDSVITAQFSAATYYANAGDPKATITVTLSQPSEYPVVVGYFMGNGTGLANRDYAARSSCLIFKPKEVSQTFDVVLLPNKKAQGDLTVFLGLDLTYNVLLGSQSRAKLIIRNTSSSAQEPGNNYVPLSDPPPGPGKGPTAAKIDPVSSPASVNPTGDINQIHNPAGIVIEPAGNRTAKNAAIVKVDLKTVMGGDAELLEWKIVSVDYVADPMDPKKLVRTVVEDVRAEFFEHPVKKTKGIGPEVYVHGLKKGRVELEVRAKDDPKLLDYHESEVVEPLALPFRVNLLSAVGGGGTTTTGTQAEVHVYLANVFLRQIGVTLVPDDQGPEDLFKYAQKEDKDKKLVDMPGYFTGTVAEYLAKKVPESQWENSISANFKKKIVQITYVEILSDDKGVEKTKYAGIIVNRPASNSKEDPIPLIYRMTVNDVPATKREMKLRPAKGTITDLWGILITNECGDPTSEAHKYGYTIAHELGHLMNLGHRGNLSLEDTDKLEDPKDKNLMYETMTLPASVDLDLIQLTGARLSPALKAPK